jgi:hypothetical protein
LKKERGKKRRIETAQELSDILQKEGEVKGYTINGDAIIEIINKKINGNYIEAISKLDFWYNS